MILGSHGVWRAVAGLLLLSAILFSDGASGQSSPQAPAMFQVEFTNAKAAPPHWVMKFGGDGNGWFDSDGSQASTEHGAQMNVGDIHRPIQVSAVFANRVFATARQRRFFNFPCEGHMKVAFQGLKRLSYSGPDGSGSCEYNYSKDKEIQSLGDSLVGVEITILTGARLEMLLQHDRLGLDKAMEDLAAQAHDGNAVEMGVIRETLEKIAKDESVLERARKKARLLLTQSR